MTRCEHLNGELVESTEYLQYFRFVDGVLVDESYVDYDRVLAYTYKCFDCNKLWRFRDATQKPKWFKKIQDLAIEDGAADTAKGA